ncbi:hypothetical protein PQX77_001774 [Marasmius sp. AFHP31]|nr:hypothetical protein PQX77_001774 [Marasmius sp. AFHP31]
MRSFSFFATLAAAALSLAAPVVDSLPGKLPGTPGTPELPKVDDALALTKGHLPQARHEQTVPELLVGITTDVTVAIDPLLWITEKNCTIEHIKPVVVEVKVILEGAVKACAELTAGAMPVAGGLLTGVLATVFSLGGKVLAVVDIAGLLAILLKVIFAALGAVLKVVADADKDVVVGLLCEIVALVVALLKIVLPLVGGLIAALLPLIVDIVVVVKALGVAHLFAGIGLQL